MSIHFSKVIVAVHSAENVPLLTRAIQSIAGFDRLDIHVLASGVSEDEIRFPMPVTMYSGNSGLYKDLVTITEQINADLVIIPVTLNEKSTKSFTTSDACKFIDKVERLVLTIPDTVESIDFRKILIPIDTSFETRQKVPYAVRFGEESRALMHVYGVSGENGKDASILIQNYLRQVSNNLVEKGFDCEIESDLGGNPTDKAMAYAKEQQCGLIVIMTEQEVSFTTFFKGRYSDQMVRKSSIPVLSIHPKDLIVSEARL